MVIKLKDLNDNMKVYDEIIVPNDATNFDVIKEIFPNYDIENKTFTE